MKSIQTKIALLFSVIFIVSTVILSYSIYQSSKKLVIDSIGSQAQSIAEKTVEMIDVKEYQQITPDNGETEYFYKLRESFIDIKETNGLEYLYTLNRRQLDNGEYEYFYVMDGSTEDAASVGDVEENHYPKLVESFETGDSYTEYTVDEYGAIATAYIPIKSAGGEIIAVLGADFNASNVQELLTKKKYEIIISTIITLALIMIIIQIATRLIVKPLKLLINEMRKVRKGDFTVQLETNRKDEIGELTVSFNEMVQDISSMIHTIKSNSRKLTISSEELSSVAEQNASSTESVSEAIQDITQGASQQLQFISNAAQTVKQMTSQVKTITNNLSALAASSQAAYNISMNGEGKIHHAIEQFEQIKQVQFQSSGVIKELGHKSKEIDEIVVVITDIANQTNLLALNAAIEAARAGEHGKGFAVVSEEVRKLAEQSAEAAKRIANLIKDIQLQTNDAVKTMENGNSEVEKGTSLIIETGQTFNEINSSIRNVTGQINNVNVTISKLASEGVEVIQVINNIERIAKQFTVKTEDFAELTENQLGMVEEVHASVEQLRTMSEKLDELVNDFQVK